MAGVVMLSKAKHVDLIDRRSVRHIIRDSSLRSEIDNHLKCLVILFQQRSDESAFFRQERSG